MTSVLHGHVHWKRVARKFNDIDALSYYPAMRLLVILLTLVSQPFVGVTYIDRMEALPRPVHMHIVQIDLAAPGLRFKLSAPAGSREVVRQSTVDFLAQEGAQIAINAHFFLPFPSSDRDAWLVGIASSEGEVFSAFEAPEQAFAIVRDAAGLNIDRENHAVIVHDDPRRADEMHVLEPAALWTTVSGSAQIVTDGAKTVPAYLDAQHPDAALKPGGPGNFSNEKSWYDAVTARTAIGLSRDGRTLTLFTVDVRGGSEGMRVGEVADVLTTDYGVWNALNLDGGGSTSMAMEDPATHTRSMVNESSDNPAGRLVGSSLAVFARSIPRP
jgi:Phosphodiester glycosidase